jgi:hypothetical protein
LIVGGVTSGQNLIRSAQLQGVVTDFKKFDAATATFRERYFQLPGDMSNATDFWGSATCPGTAGTGTQTCNGDGDGQVLADNGANNYGENFTFWQHMPMLD